LPEQAAASEEPPPAEAKTDSFFESRFEPHFGQGVPCHRLDLTRISLSASHFLQ
jgi:hypothetical protein